jgi:predicted amidophosphoribosyltransferase
MIDRERNVPLSLCRNCRERLAGWQGLCWKCFRDSQLRQDRNKSETKDEK